MAGTVVKPGDLLLNITGGSMGRCCRVPADFIEANISQHVAIIRLILGGMQDFLHRLILSPYFQSFIFNEQTGAGRGGLPKNRMDRIPVAVPPLAEQHRIVAKVDELMAICDQLEAARSERERRRDQLTEASLNRLKHPEKIDESTFREHARFHLRHFPSFTTRPDQIAQLRQTILNLAVRGRLVSQNANSESIAAFLEAVDTERSATAERDRRANKERQKLLASELCWTTPTSWVWRALADLALFIDYRGQTPAKCEFGVRLLTAKNVRAGFINLEPQEFIDEPTYERWMTRGLPRERDVLFTTEAPMGNAAVLKLSHKIGLAQRVINFRLYGGLNPDFLVLQILSDPFQKILAATATGLTAKGIKAAKLKRLPIAVPPLAEQQRIVAKVKELMSLCDRLETEIKISQTQRRLLLEAVLHQALSIPA
jgi:type I restriction enzyme S subunit